MMSRHSSDSYVVLVEVISCDGGDRFRWRVNFGGSTICESRTLPSEMSCLMDMSVSHSILSMWVNGLFKSSIASTGRSIEFKTSEEDGGSWSWHFESYVGPVRSGERDELILFGSSQNLPSRSECLTMALCSYSILETHINRVSRLGGNENDKQC